MGYDVHITRRQHWSDDALDISETEWRDYVASDPEMRLDGYAEARSPDGAIIRYDNPLLAVWTAYSRHKEGSAMVWFDFQDGTVTVKNPDPEVLQKMWAISQALEARVQGDEGEIYDAAGNADTGVEPKIQTGKRPWWKIW